MATKSVAAQAAEESEKLGVVRTLSARSYLEWITLGYARICMRKHGFDPHLFSPETLKEMTDDELRVVHDELRDMAHLPPA